MLRAAPRVEIQVMETVSGREVLLGRCFVAPEECFHTQCDPQWKELFKGNPEMDEGNIYVGVQVIPMHLRDQQGVPQILNPAPCTLHPTP